jgi:isocitrate lyase
MVWCETGTPDLDFARRFAEGIRRKFPGKMLAYNCSPSFNWKRNLDDATIARFQRELGAMGYKFQFITLAGFHSLNYGMFELAHGYARNDMTAFVELQQKEFAAAEKGFTANQAPARGRDELLRRRDPGRIGRQGFDHGAARLHRGRAVLRREEESQARSGLSAM